jgi:hypothetical protein
MSERETPRPDQFGGDFDAAVRNALVAAAESVEPSADGLDRIRTKIVAHRRGRLAGVPWWRSLPTARQQLSTVFGEALERLRPDPNRVGWLGWLRPAVAIATGLFVVTAASLAVAALPQAIQPSGNSRAVSTSSPTRPHRSAKPSSYSPSGPGGVIMPGQGPSPGGTPTCSPTPTGSGSPSPSGSPSGSPSPSGSTSPSGGTPSPSTSTSPAPFSSPSGSPSPSQSPGATGKLLLSPDAGQDAMSAAPLAGPPGTTGDDSTPAPSVTAPAAPEPSATVTPQPSPTTSSPCPG